MKLCMVEDHGYKNLTPLTKTRPSFGLRCGRFTLEERILKILEPHIEQVHYILRPELEGVWKHRYKANTDVNFNMLPENNGLYLNGRVLFDEESLMEIFQRTELKKPFVLKDGPLWIAMYLPVRSPWFSVGELQNGTVDFSGVENQKYVNHAIISYPWELIKYNSGMICKDFTFLKKRMRKMLTPPLPAQVAGLKRHQLMIGQFNEIQPFVTFDATEGPIIVGDHVKIEAGTYIKGPVSIGDDCLVSANTKLYNNTTLGNTCKIGGEVSHSIIHGFSNKRHSGFLGNSYLGEWINLGAGTNNSNLKNNYNTITVPVKGRDIETHSQFIGLFMGDHSRSAIGTLFNTATFVGVGCNVFGSGLTPKQIDDFTWGGIESADIYDFQKFIKSVRRVMVRREMELNQAEIELLSRLYQSRLIPEKKEDFVANQNQEQKNGV